ncbi:MAG: hypothetical protein KatS3mg053_0329 [Candidatus Roseilinea sp.]|nr:MAG: hypothetical protein KatS3mg053_0329 [Candidatus Roseilinea sp.]
MTSSPTLTQRTIGDAFDHIAQATYCQAGAVIALSGALAAGLAQATANVSLEEGVSGEAHAAARQMQQAVSQARMRFQALADQDAEAIAAFVALRERGEALQGYAVLCDGSREMADLALGAAQAMQGYRAHVCERAKDDLEFALALMSNTARAAMLLLDSNLRIWPLPELTAHYDPHVTRLAAAIAMLRPVERIRPPC